MTDAMIIQRLRKISADLRRDKAEYATEHSVSIDASDEVCRASCSNLCDLIADDLQECIDYQKQQEEEKRKG